MRIAISGPMSVGKTCMAEKFIQDYGFKKLSFAGKLREIAKFLYDLTDDDLYGPNKRRDLLQKVGHGFREQISPTFWIDIVRNEIKKNPDENYVIDDVRYKNEFDMLKELGFIMVRVEAPEEVRRQRSGNSFIEPNHPGEIDLNDVLKPWEEGDGRKFDIFVQNVYKSKEEYQRCVDVIYKSYSENSSSK